MSNAQQLNIDLTGKIALITGASSGIGRRIALAYARAGATVIVADLQEEGRGEDTTTSELIAAEGKGKAVFVRCNVTEQDDIDAAIAKAKELGGLDILVNNAGIFNTQAFVDVTRKDFDLMFDINVKGVFFVAQAATKLMLEQGRGGSIINLSSVAGLQGSGGFTNYTASKGAVRLLTLSMSQELGGDGIRVNAIHPGLIETSMTTKDVPVTDGDAGAQFAAAIPLGRFGTPTDIAGIALFLASDLSQYVTGSSVLVDGGMLRI